MAKGKDKPSFEALANTMQPINTPVQKVVPVNTDDDYSNEAIANYSMQLPVKLRDNLKIKSVLEKKPMKDLIIKALLNTYPDIMD